MLFNSIEYLLFLPTVFILYWLIQDKTWWRNLFIVAVSYLFYGWWDWRFLGLIIFSSVVDYSIGRAMGRADDVRMRKRLLWMSLATNLGILAFFKYFNFFTESFADTMQGTQGISFTKRYLAHSSSVDYLSNFMLSYSRKLRQ